jgi:hypothetical protein
MMEYRAYIVGPDGHFLNRIEFVCESDEAASERARTLLDGHAIELWCGEHLIAQFRPDGQDPLAPPSSDIPSGRP